MKIFKYSGFSVALLVLSVIQTWSQTYEWSKSFNANNNVQVSGIAIDSVDNTVVAILDFKNNDLNYDGDVYTNIGAEDGMVVKIDVDGNTVWTFHFGSTGTDVPKDLDIDDFGNIYVTGSFSDGCDFNGEEVLNSVDNEDIFLLKISRSGNLVWVNNVAGGKGQDRGNGLAVDDDNNVQLVGWFNDSLIFEGDTLETNGHTNNFYGSFDSDGNYLSATQVFGNNDGTRLNSVSIANDGGYLISGYFYDTLRFTDSVPTEWILKGQSSSESDVVLLKINTNKNVDWLRKGGSSTEDQGLDARSDAAGNIYLCGFFTGSAIFDSTGTNQSTALVSYGAEDAFLIKYNSEGRLLWKTHDGGVGYDISRRMGLFGDFVLYTGHFSDTVINGNDTLIAKGGTYEDTGFGVRNSNGDYISYSQTVGNDIDRGLGIALNKDLNIYISGMFRSDSLFIGNDTLINQNYRKKQGFLAKAFWPLSVSVTQNINVSCKGDSDGVITVTPYFGDPPYTYQWEHDPGETDSTVTGLKAGSYKVVVTDDSGEKDSITTTVTEPNLILIDKDIDSVKCYNQSDGAIDVTVTGGTPSYIYNWSSPDGSGYATSSEDQTGLTVGTYNLTVTDSHGCTADSSFFVDQPSQLVIDSIIKTDATTGSLDNGTAQVYVSGGTPGYDYSWSNGDTSALADSLGGDTYTILVTDTNSCSANGQVTIGQPGVLVASAEISNVSCADSADGSVVISVTGGTKPYDYIWSDDPLRSDSFAIDLGPDTITCIVNGDGGGADTVTVIISEPSALSPLLDKTNPRCYGSMDGTVESSISGGTPGYHFLWNTGDTTANLSNLDKGFFSLTVTDANGCIAVRNALLLEPDSLHAEFSVDSVNCYGGSSGSIDLTVSGGYAPYSYLWSNTSTTEDQNFQLADEYWVRITDDTGCVKFDTVNIYQPTKLTASIVDFKNSCAGLNDGSATVAAGGGIPPYSYLWDDPNGQSSATATDLNPYATYTAVVTDLHGCTANKAKYIDEAAPIIVTEDSTFDVSCSGYDDGAIYVSISGGVFPLSYEWSNLDTTEDITNLAGDDYDLTVTDADGCLGLSSTITIQDNTVPIVITTDTISSDILCFGNTGEIILKATGGVGSLEYSIDNGSTYQSDTLFTSISSGDYNTLVRDGSGCLQYGDTLVVTDPAQLVINGVDSTAVLCNGSSDGTITISASGGTGTLQYSIDSAQNYFVNGGNFTSIEPGIYHLFVADSNNCEVNAGQATINEPESILIDSIVQEDVTCNRAADGRIIIYATGGSGTLKFSVDSAGSFVENSGSFTTVDTGTYYVFVGDTNDCQVSGGAITIEEPIVLNATVDSSNISCYGSTDGLIKLMSITGGSGFYEFTIDGGTNWQTDSSFTSLMTGMYDVRMRDSIYPGCGLTLNSSLDISEPDSLHAEVTATDVTCNGFDNGTITVSNTSGGSGSYEYSFDGGSNWDSDPDTIVGPGTYQVMIRDSVSVSCVKDLGNIDISDAGLLDANLDSTDVSCFGADNGKIDISNQSGGSGYYEYNIGSGWGSTTEYINLDPGEYIVIMRDSLETSCMQALDTITISEPAAMTADATADTISCYGAMNGRIIISGAAGGMPPHEFSIDGGTNWQTDSIFTALDGGTYDVRMRDDPSCEVILDPALEVVQPDSLWASIMITDATCSGIDDGAIELGNASGGSGTYENSIDGGRNWQADSTFIGLPPDVYNIRIRDAADTVCENVLDRDLELMAPDALIADTSHTEITCNGLSDGTITIDNPTGGSGNYQYSIDSGATWIDSGEFTDLEAGIYYVMIRDEASTGCVVYLGAVAIIEPGALAITGTALMEISCAGEADGSIVTDAEGGTPPLTFTLNPGGASNNDGVFTGLAAGKYTVSVDDANMCGPVISDTVEVTEPDTLAIDSLKVSDTFPGADSGRVFIRYEGGSSPVQIHLESVMYDFSSDSTKNITGLAPGDYELYLMDSHGCATPDTMVTIGESSADITVYRAFTPNGDGYNDYWNIDIKGLEDEPDVHIDTYFPDCIVKVYNSWGNLVFSSNGYDEPWDGTYNGTNLPGDTYFYAIDLYGDGSDVRTGSVTIIR